MELFRGLTLPANVRVTGFTLAFSMLRVFPLYGLMGLKELIVGLNV